MTDLAHQIADRIVFAIQVEQHQVRRALDDCVSGPLQVAEIKDIAESQDQHGVAQRRPHLSERVEQDDRSLFEVVLFSYQGNTPFGLYCSDDSRNSSPKLKFQGHFAVGRHGPDESGSLWAGPVPPCYSRSHGMA